MTLYPFQQQAVEWLKTRPVGLLHAATGTGKTIMALEYLRLIDEATQAKLERPAKMLVIVPNAVKYQWQKQAKDLFGIDMQVIGGTPAERIEHWKNLGAYTLINYELLLKDIKYVLTHHFDCVVADECHRMANPTAKSVRAIKKIRTHRKLAMSATPISNGRHDLYSQIDWLSPGSLGRSYTAFKQEYCIVHTKFYKILGIAEHKQHDFTARTTRHIYPITKDVLTDLPPLGDSVVPFYLSREERRIYDQIKKELILELVTDDGRQEFEPIGNALTKLLRLRQSVNGLAQWGNSSISSKLRTLTELLEDLLLDPENKVLIFTSFKETANEYYKELTKEWEGELIVGDVQMHDRAARLVRFEERKECRFLLGTSAMDTGLNIQAANIIIHIDDPLSYAKLDQRNGRAWRIGQQKPVTVYHLRAIDTIDEYIAQLLAMKKYEASFTWADIKSLLK